MTERVSDDMACDNFTATEDHPNKCTCGEYLSAHIDSGAGGVADDD
jgi:hypothetical protein